MPEELCSVEPVCLFGAGGHGRVVAAQIAQSAPSVKICFGDSNPILHETDRIKLRFCDIAQISGHTVIITIGDNFIRRQLQLAAQDAGLKLGRVVIDPTRYFASMPGPGAQVLAGAVVNPGARIGAGVIINSNAVAEHDSSIGDFCHLAPGSVAGGKVVLGDGVLLGTNATVLPGLRVAPGCVIGAGAVVACHLDQPGIYVGVPARPLPKTKGSLA